jgi:hypothetical protein
MVKIGRNDPCPCGSGKKYKHCCSLDLVKNEKILRAAAQVSTYEELVALLNQPSKIYRLQVTLDSIRSQKPRGTVSRMIEIEADNTLYDLHWEIQNAFGWDNDHLFSYYMSNRIGDEKSEYSGNPLGGDPSSIEAEPSGTAAQTEIRNLGLKKRKKFKYLFDYGDHLIHTVEVLGVFVRGDEEATYPRVVEKIGDSPSQYGYSEE